MGERVAGKVVVGGADKLHGLLGAAVDGGLEVFPGGAGGEGGGGVKVDVVAVAEREAVLVEESAKDVAALGLVLGPEDA